MVQPNKSEAGLPPELVKAFNEAPEKDVEIALTKKDIELLINTLAELHSSYASLLKGPFLTLSSTPGVEAETEQHAERSYGLFVELAGNLMTRYLETGAKDER